MRPELQGLPEPNWFHHGEQILTLLETHRPMNCVELGTNKGCSAMGIARILSKWGGCLVCVDLWELEWEERANLQECAQNIANDGLRNVRFIQASTFEAARDWKLGPIDFLYIDADHSKEGCGADLVNWWPHLRMGGVLAGDDYDDPHGNPSLGVTAAWDEFEMTHNQQFERTISPLLLGCQCARCQRGRLIWGIKR